jgi:hypothetical protein
MSCWPLVLRLLTIMVPVSILWWLGSWWYVRRYCDWPGERLQLWIMAGWMAWFLALGSVWLCVVS